MYSALLVVCVVFWMCVVFCCDVVCSRVWHVCVDVGCDGSRIVFVLCVLIGVAFTCCIILLGMMHGAGRCTGRKSFACFVMCVVFVVICF